MPRKTKTQEPVATPAPVEPEVQPEPVPKKRTRKVKLQAEPTEIPAPVSTPEPVEAKPKKTSKWLQALKEWNLNKEKYTIPKKDTNEYEEIKNLMAKLSV